MTQGDGLAVLLTGPKSRRAEFAITEVMDAAIVLLMGSGPWSRSDACRIFMARGVKSDPDFLARAIEAVRLSRERDAADQAQREE